MWSVIFTSSTKMKIPVLQKALYDRTSFNVVVE